jgi:ABC-type protease/lipase transport system fused ATPase/permease subunit
LQSLIHQAHHLQLHILLFFFFFFFFLHLSLQIFGIIAAVVVVVAAVQSENHSSFIQASPVAAMTVNTQETDSATAPKKIFTPYQLGPFKLSHR